jgi:hypothetical protein
MSETTEEKVDLTKLTPAEAGQLAVDAAIAAARKEAQESGREVSDEDAPDLVSEESKRIIFSDAADAHQMFLTGVAEAEAALPAQQAAAADAKAAEEAHAAEVAKAAEAEAADAAAPPAPLPGDTPPVEIGPDPGNAGAHAPVNG